MHWKTIFLGNRLRASWLGCGSELARDSHGERRAPARSPSPEGILPPAPERRRWFALLAISGAYYAFIYQFPQWIDWLGLKLFQWGLDALIILVASDTARAGGDVFAPMAWDPLQRPLIYSSWWLRVGDLGLTRVDNALFSAIQVALFLVAAFTWLRPRTRVELACFAAAACSTPVVYALIRANADLLIFALLAPLVPCVLSGSRWAQLGASLLIALATGLKYYPVVAGLMLLAIAPQGPRWGAIALCLAALALVYASIRADLPKFAAGQPPIGEPFSLGAQHAFGVFGIAKTTGKLIGLGCVAALAALTVATPWLRDWRPRPEARRDYLHFILGATLLAGCFWAEPSHAYRWVFALWLVPFLGREARRPELSGAQRRLIMIPALLLWPLLFGDTLFSLAAHALRRWAHTAMPIDGYTFTLWQQPLAWAFFGVLTMFVVQFAWTQLAETWQRIRAA